MYVNESDTAKLLSRENINQEKLENIYRLMWHFFQFLGVIKVNESDTAKLLYAENINQEKLFEYAREAADFATEYQMPHLDFAVNHYGKPDVAMFDFTSMFQVNKGTNEFHILPTLFSQTIQGPLNIWTEHPNCQIHT